MTRWRADSGGVPLLRRQLAADALPLALSIMVVAAAVALVLVLMGLRRGLGEQVSVYLDHQPALLVAQEGSVNFLSQVSALPDGTVEELGRVAGVAAADPIAQQYAMLRVRGRFAVSVLVGYEPGRQGGPWKLAQGREPATHAEVAVDEVFAADHDLRIGDRIAYRGEQLRIVGLSAESGGFMAPLVFTTLATADALAGGSSTTAFVLVRPAPGTTTAKLARSIERSIEGVVALDREVVAERDRQVFVRAFSGLLATMVTIAFAVALVVIATSTYAAVAARNRELATLRAIGMGSGRLARVALGHGLTLAVFGGVVGVGLSYAAAWGIHEAAPRYLVSIAPVSPAAALAVTLVLGVVATLVPVRALVTVDPAKAFQR